MSEAVEKKEKPGHSSVSQLLQFSISLYFVNFYKFVVIPVCSLNVKCACFFAFHFSKLDRYPSSDIPVN